jgi:endonuclease/exonuclease/phosphatase family metal-dependent hydrolase
LGDLNMTPPTPERVTGWRAIAGACTFPADQPTRQLDHVLVDDRQLRVLRVDAPELPISDHRALIVDVEPC